MNFYVSKRGMRPQSGHRARHAYSEGRSLILLLRFLGLLSVQEHRGEMWIYDVDVVKSDAMKNQRNPRVFCDMRALLETHWGLLSIKEHREETLTCDVKVVKSNAVTKSTNANQIW